MSLSSIIEILPVQGNTMFEGKLTPGNDSSIYPSNVFASKHAGTVDVNWRFNRQYNRPCKPHVGKKFSPLYTCMLNVDQNKRLNGGTIESEQAWHPLLGTVANAHLCTFNMGVNMHV